MPKQNKSFMPLSEDEKTELVTKYEFVVNYYAYRYRYLDLDIDDVKGWGYLGLVHAINKYELNREEDFKGLAFYHVKTEIYRVYFKKGANRSKKTTSLNSELFDNGEGSIENTLADEDSLLYFEIKQIAEEALFEESNLLKKINMDYLFTAKELGDLSKEYKIQEAKLKRILRRGQGLIKSHLYQNEIIVDYASKPTEERKKKEKIINHKEIPIKDFGKIRYLSRHYSNVLQENDIAILLNTSAYMVQQLLDYPTYTYLTSKPDSSIKEKAMRYIKKKYPETIPSEVTCYKEVYA
ncbi:hypothetical protein BKP37_00685 [Anaerobacillus alkalilacustris]|uniref:Uncharacterized protein n=1 Tax=Anaerobacillus alkalilacustris TaxID=393763 RepID=A0A1S2LXY0_9BACI|nr:sigma-70 family RNA polymerase sigma factor [Anaerobacillus alkalilacustris]OIJ17090.1 hypothetical protein BKP37_00685 [Anaerobacillus alkalilacustris]